MEFCQLGTQGPTVSRVAFGAMTFGNWSYETFHAGVDQVTADRMVSFALARDAEHEILPYCGAAGMGALIWSPLAGGFLTGRYTDAHATDVQARSRCPPTRSGPACQAIELMRAVAGQHGISVTQVAISWLLAKPGVSSLLVGASRPEQLAESVVGAEVRLSDGELAALDAIQPPAPIYPSPKWWSLRPSAQAPFVGPPNLWVHEHSDAGLPTAGDAEPRRRSGRT